MTKKDTVFVGGGGSEYDSGSDAKSYESSLRLQYNTQLYDEQNSRGVNPVDSLERDWGTRWRSSDEKNYFSTRKTIVDEVRARARKDGLAEEVVARQMDEERGFSSLDRLFKAVRGRRRSEEVTPAVRNAEGCDRERHTG